MVNVVSWRFLRRHLYRFIYPVLALFSAAGVQRVAKARHLKAWLMAGLAVSWMAAGVIPTSVAAAPAPPSNCPPSNCYDIQDRGLFELDGNTAHDASTTPPYDWGQVFGSSGNNVPPGSRLLPIGTTATGLDGHPYMLKNSTFLNDGGTDLAFITGGSKDINNPAGNWNCTEKPVTPKDEIDNAYAALWQDQINPGHTVMYMAIERGVVNGTSNAAFWLLQNPVTCSVPAGASQGTFTGNHTNGDLLFFATFNGGGNTATIDVYTWVGGATGHLSNLQAVGEACDISTASPCGMVNAGNTQTPWPPHNTSATALQQNGFFEMGVDLNDFFGGLNSSVPCFNGLLADTRASGSQGNAISSELHDYIAGGFSNCGHVAITKDTSTPSVNAGDQISYTLTANNTGTGPAHNVVVTDSVPAPAGTNWSVSSVTPGTTSECTIGQPSGGSQALSCNLGDLDAGTGVTITLTSSTTAASCGVLANTGHISSDTNSGDSNESDITVNCPSLAITKSTDTGSVSAGDPIHYSITVTNNGPGASYGTTVADSVPAPAGTNWSVFSVTPGSTSDCTIGSPSNNTQALSCGLGTLAAGTSVTIVLHSGTTAASCGVLKNTATAGDSNGGGSPTSNEADITVNCANLGIAKSTDTPTVNAGDTIHYSITVTNSGAGTARSVTVDDSVPAPAGTNWSVSSVSPGSVSECSIGAPSGGSQVLDCSLGDMAPSAVVTIKLSSGTTSASCGVLKNTAHAGSSNDGSPTSNEADITVNCPHLAINKSTDTPVVNNGTQIDYSVNVQNTGAGASYNTTVTDSVPAPAGTNWSVSSVTPGSASECSIGSPTAGAQSLTCHLGTLASGGSVTISLTSGTTAESCGVLKNTASASDSNGGGNPTSNEADITVNCPSLSVIKGTDTPTVSAGDQISYTIAVSNGGPAPSLNTMVTDSVPAPAGTDWSVSSVTPGTTSECTIGAPSGNSQVLSCSLGTLDAESSVSITLTSATTAASCGVLKNTASASDSNGGGSPTSNEADITVNCPSLALVKKADDPKAVPAGTSIGFLITLTNTGLGTATGVVLSDNLPNVPTTAGSVWVLGTTTKTGSDLANVNCLVSSATTQVLTCGLGTVAPLAAFVMAPGDSISVHLTHATDGGSPGVYPNTATATSTNNPPLSSTAQEAVLSLTTAASAAVAVGQGISDVATIHGGNSPTGTVTFHLYAPGDTNCTGTDLVAGNSAYTVALSNGQATSPTFTSAAAGTYQWVAQYSGDASNMATTGKCGDPGEQVTTFTAAVQAAVLPAQTGDWTIFTVLGAPLVLIGIVLLALSRRRQEGGA